MKKFGENFSFAQVDNKMQKVIPVEAQDCGIFYSDELCQACNDVEGIKLRKAETAALGQL